MSDAFIAFQIEGESLAFDHQALLAEIQSAQWAAYIKKEFEAAKAKGYSKRLLWAMFPEMYQAVAE